MATHIAPTAVPTCYICPPSSVFKSIHYKQLAQEIHQVYFATRGAFALFNIHGCISKTNSIAGSDVSTLRNSELIHCRHCLDSCLLHMLLTMNC
jgi:hypothetical protein